MDLYTIGIDIGKTNISFGVFEGKELHTTWRMATVINQMADEYAALLLNLLGHQDLETSDIKEDISVCRGETYTLPDGNKVGTEGTYISSFIAETGCDSTIIHPARGSPCAASHLIYFLNHPL